MPYVPTNIVSFVPGTYTPGAETAAKMAVDFANGTWNQAGSLVYDAKAAITALTDPTTGYLHGADPASISAGSITVTAPTEPTITLSDLAAGTVSTDVSAQASTLASTALSAFSTFMTTWFPAQGTTSSSLESWLNGKLTNTTSGAIPAGVQAAILATEKAKISAAQVQAQADADESWASRRHKRPTGAQAAQALRITQTALDAAADAARGIAVKDFDMSFQAALEAAKLALANRDTALRAAHDYIVAAIMQTYSSSAQAIQIARDAEAKAKATAYAAFSQRINAQELALKATSADKTLALDASKANLSADIQMIDFNVKAFVTQLQGLIQMATAFANNARTGSSTSYTVNGT